MAVQEIFAEDGDLHEELRRSEQPAVRAAIREGRFRGQTGGLAAGYLQGNLAILPADLALDFARFCQRNPKPCPLVGVSDTGDPMLRTLGADIDIRTDVPNYNVYRDGALAEQRADIADLWREDSVAFVLGCSFSFEEALQDAEVPLRHVETNRTVPMYRTNIACLPAGPFNGNTVVSMRPMSPEDAIRAVEVTARFPMTHGTPLHMGDPAGVGIADIASPDWGDQVEIHSGEIPVFWACGVTPQNVVLEAGLPLCITHTPGSMLITDLPGNNIKALSN
jgi:uncharacterized protein YcsI (UPF0317 family)